MQLAFQDEKLRTLCESSIKAKRQFGESAADALQNRLADLRAADSLSTVVGLGLGKIVADVPSRIEISLGDGCVMVASPNHRPEPRLETGELNWHQVTRLKILSICRANQ
ncbi:hypothetical protein [Pandoraea terrigena]|uniref:hypothetical protein n=1 Tax=Pandoraea terrigena TaxID=2508292 RepID=UPI0012412A16|nr:hypothetical protein [Pandoraea terrigena]